MTRFSDERRGFDVTFPSGWMRADRVLTPMLTAPREILSVGTVEPVPNDESSACAQHPVETMERVGPRDVLVTILERIERRVGRDAPGAAATGRGHPRRQRGAAVPAARRPLPDVLDAVPDRRPRVLRERRRRGRRPAGGQGRAAGGARLLPRPRDPRRGRPPARRALLLSGALADLPVRSSPASTCRSRSRSARSRSSRPAPIPVARRRPRCGRAARTAGCCSCSSTPTSTPRRRIASRAGRIRFALTHPRPCGRTSASGMSHLLRWREPGERPGLPGASSTGPRRWVEQALGILDSFDDLQAGRVALRWPPCSDRESSPSTRGAR